MITLITGVPGGGKTLYCVSEILKKLDESQAKLPPEQRRRVFVDGIPDLLTEHETSPDPLLWPDWAPDGSLIVIDEVQRIWRPEASSKAPHPSIAALETHRHRGLDFVIMTQHPNLIHANVRRLVGRHIHLRRTALGTYLYEWSECVTPDSAWKNALVKVKWSHPKSSFGLYKSASIHQQVKHRIPKAVFIFIFAALFAVGLIGYTFYEIYGQVTNRSDAIEHVGSSSSPQADTASPQKKPSTPPVVTAPVPSFSMPWGATRIVLSGISGTRRGIHFKGVIVFELTIGGSQYFATDEDLRSMGYRVNSLSDDRASIIDSKGRTLDMFFNPRPASAPVDYDKERDQRDYARTSEGDAAGDARDART